MKRRYIFYRLCLDCERVGLRRVTLEADVVAALRFCGAPSFGFFDRSLAQFAAHLLANLKLFCYGDLRTGRQHVVESIGAVLGMLTSSIQSVECKNRFSAVAPSADGALLNLSVDSSGRSRLRWDCEALDNVSNAIDNIRIARVFFDALAHNRGASVCVSFAEADDWHHAAEALLKSFGMRFRLAFGSGNDVSVSTRGKPK
ncbi:MAG: Imidazoleglycerol-phosphate dehydratase [Candidatus Hodgkinia cicadicola]|nr:MAG: Imidazoleglycerol-phosphate dehydratase [Candidatus Hodgkinia cicadicola]